MGWKCSFTPLDELVDDTVIGVEACVGVVSDFGHFHTSIYTVHVVYVFLIGTDKSVRGHICVVSGFDCILARFYTALF